MMRPGGRTAEVRQMHGFEKVVFLAPPQAFEAVMALREFTKDVFEHARAGRDWSTQGYKSEYAQLFNSSYTVAGPKINVDFSNVSILEEEPAEEDSDVEVNEQLQPVERRRLTARRRQQQPRVVVEAEDVEAAAELPQPVRTRTRRQVDPEDVREQVDNTVSSIDHSLTCS